MCVLSWAQGQDLQSWLCGRERREVTGAQEFKDLRAERHSDSTIHEQVNEQVKETNKSTRLKCILQTVRSCHLVFPHFLLGHCGWTCGGICVTHSNTHTVQQYGWTSVLLWSPTVPPRAPGHFLYSASFEFHQIPPFFPFSLSSFLR